ncbi:MAG: nucleotide exchange factor GrpE [Nitrospira sp.]|nr:nucleotide exchange factor GrpE [Nitrospira sp.]MDH4243447.1 nucleotide exchange factor GrpE [Nitrospira sp.]MDH4357812.1 nucleotide exchange factor GrpE [Nitrospira sp.]MDH5316850.1 nucleotide exchange factor GrpE [Nitrospira sp.]
MNEPQDEENKKSNTIDSLEDSSLKNETGNAAHASAEEEPAVKAEEYQSLNSKYLRLAAEFDNYKRLSQRDQRDQIRFGNEQLLKELLPVVDNMERAIKAARTNGGDAALVQGVELTLKQLSGVLAKFGVQAIDSAGQDFDPSAHQAVSYGPSDEVPANKVLDEFQKGYRLHDRILRAAMVSVSSGPAQANEHDATTN